jgi:HSP20 family molecular chaperone IbpA
MLENGYSHKYLTNGIAKREASISWSLNVKVDLDKFKTTYKNGILTIALPLMKEEQTEEIISEIED